MTDVRQQESAIFCLTSDVPMAMTPLHSNTTSVERAYLHDKRYLYEEHLNMLYTIDGGAISSTHTRFPGCHAVASDGTHT